MDDSAIPGEGDGPPVPPREDPTARDQAALARVRAEAAGCKACDLWLRGTQTVFGAGPAPARIMLVGEQPGDREDLEGLPFVGPAGGELDDALEEAGIDRADVYVTNTVKHFKWIEGRGDRRIHKKPNVAEIAACRPWLDAELRLVRPELVVCLGATAAQALLGREVSVTRDRGAPFHPDFAPLATVTVHPSSILRQRDREERHRARRELAGDLAAVARLLEG